MGLDMYLNAKKYLSGEEKMGAKLRKQFNVPTTGNLEYAELKFEIGYWREANHIHKWFVDTVQGGKDDCGNYYVSLDKLKRLRALCQQAADAEEPDRKKILPTLGGFFFGEDKYGEYYVSGCKNTIAIVDRILAWPEHESFQYEYTSSW